MTIKTLEVAGLYSAIKSMRLPYNKEHFSEMYMEVDTTSKEFFGNHFYTAHYEDIEGVMDGESMTELTMGQYEKIKK